MNTFNSSKLPKKTLASTSTSLPTLSAIEFVRHGATIQANNLTVAEWYRIIEHAVETFRPHFKYFYFLETGKCLQLPLFLVAHNYMLEPNPDIIQYNDVYASFQDMPKLMALARLSCEGTPGSQTILERHLLLSRNCEFIELTRKIEKTAKYVLPSGHGFSSPTLNGEIIARYSFRIFHAGDLFAELAKPSVTCLGLTILYALKEQALIAVRSKRQAADDIEEKVNSLLEIRSRIEV